MLVQIAFGVLVWELFTHGLVPYPDMRNSQVQDLVKTVYRMESPENCPPRVYDLMRHCWEDEPENRPTFSEVLTTLNSISEGKSHENVFSEFQNKHLYNKNPAMVM